MRIKTQTEVIRENVDKTLQELLAPEKPVQTSRAWKSPNGYRYLVQWSNSVLLRYFVRLFTASLPKSEYRRKAQLDDCARSVVRNIEEGWKRATTKDYLDFIGYSQGSLEETKGDVRELTEDGFLPTKPRSSLAGIGINLGDFNKSLHPISSSKPPLGSFKGKLEDIRGNKKPNPTSDLDFVYRPITVLYPPLAKVKVSDLTYEIFLELINKTDFLLRTLVASLEKKSPYST